MTLLFTTRQLRSDNFVFYLPGTHHLLPLQEIEQAKYLPLLPVLNLVGKVSGLQEKKKTLKVWVGDEQLELRQSDPHVRLKKINVKLPHPVRVSNGQWMVPVEFLTGVLPQLTRQPIEYQIGSHRVFIGDVRPGSFTVRLDQIANGSRLTLQFTNRVNVRTAARDGRWVLYLGDRPIEPLEQTTRFQDPYLSQLQFDDQDGVPKLILTPATPGLDFYPTLTEGGKILLADVVKPPSPVVSARSPEETVGKPSSAAQPLITILEESPAAPPGPPLPAVVLDAGHGGEDAGARGKDGVAEKDLVAQLVSRVRLELLASKKYRIVLTRAGDVNPTFEQRDVAANLARAEVFLTFHAGDLGPGAPRVAVYTYAAMPAPPSAPDAPAEALFFTPWAKAQQGHLERSRQLAQMLSEKIGQIPGVQSVLPSAAPVRSLRSVNAPAVALEIGSLAPEADSTTLTNVEFQQRLAGKIVEALQAFGGKQG